MLVLLTLAACILSSQEEAPLPAQEDPIIPAEATLHRLSESQWRNAVEDATGVRFPGELPGDYVIQGYSAVGAAEVTIAPTDLELYEAAAWDVAEEALPHAEILDCTLLPPLGEEDLSLDSTACLRGWLARTGSQAWRRPLSQQELDTLVGLVHTVADTSESMTLGLRAGLASVILSPHFLFRVDRGIPDPQVNDRVCFTGFERASRLSFLLWDTGPDEELLAAAAAGDLESSAGIRAQAERLLDDPQARLALADFWAEYMDLARVALVDKDPNLYPQVDEALREAMVEEVRLLFDDFAFGDQNFLELWTTDLAWANSDLAAVYGTTLDGDALQRIRLTGAEDRGGLMGRAAFLFLNAHATVNSPTLRGKFVRDTLLCQDIPPPPAGLDTSLTTVEEGTLRDQLEQHMTDPSCGGCHVLMDPIGFGLEHFDPIGQRRELDNGFPIDATGDLDGAAFDGATELGEALAGHPSLPGCLVQQLYRHATGSLPRGQENIALAAFTDALLDSGGSFRELLLTLVTDQVFRTAADAGSTPPEEALCNGRDDDFDGETDEDLEQACEGEHGTGTQECVDGSWGPCEGPAAAWETCDGTDEDADGLVDEALSVDVLAVDWNALTTSHSDCDSVSDTLTGACYAATHRSCAAQECSVTGWGPVAIDDTSERSALLCLDDAEAVTVPTTYSEMQAIHSGCNTDSRLGRDCNAAISRFCSSEGLITGFGPLENSGDDLWVACTPGATYVDTTYTALSAHEPLCNGANARDGESCNAAIHQYCRANGHVSGFGPLENSGDTAHIACVGVHPEAE